jgi:RNA polymerase sigma-70 factor (ECF subfamily)
VEACAHYIKQKAKVNGRAARFIFRKAAESNTGVAVSRSARPAWNRPCLPGWTARMSPESVPDTLSDILASESDAIVVQACLEGNRGAFDVIVRRHQRQIYQLCYRFVGNHEDASDLAQDVFVRAFRGLRGFKGDAAFGTWLYRIGVNVCLNRVGSRRPAFAPLTEARHEDSRAERPDARVLRGERAAEVRAAIARLPDKQRATLILRVYHDLPHAEIAAVLGSSVGAVKANFFHALANLKKLLEGQP